MNPRQVSGPKVAQWNLNPNGGVRRHLMEVRESSGCAMEVVAWKEAGQAWTSVGKRGQAWASVGKRGCLKRGAKEGKDAPLIQRYKAEWRVFS